MWRAKSYLPYLFALGEPSLRASPLFPLTGTKFAPESRSFSASLFVIKPGLSPRCYRISACPGGGGPPGNPTPGGGSPPGNAPGGGKPGKGGNPGGGKPAPPGGGGPPGIPGGGNGMPAGGGNGSPAGGAPGPGGNGGMGGMPLPPGTFEIVSG